MTNNIKDYNDQYNDAIDNEPTLDDDGFNLSIGTRDPLTVVTVSIRGGKKHRETVVAGLTCSWDSGATGSMIKRRHTEHYERNMRSNRVEYSTAAGMYCTTHDVKVHFCILEFSGSKIINHRFHLINMKANME